MWDLGNNKGILPLLGKSEINFQPHIFLSPTLVSAAILL